MIVALLYPPTILIGETPDLELVDGSDPSDLALVLGPNVRDRVRFKALARLDYGVDRIGRKTIGLQNLGPWDLLFGSWAAWKIPDPEQMQAWEQLRAALAGLVTLGTPGANGARPC